MSRTGTNEEEKSGSNRLTVWTLSGMTDLHWLCGVAILIPEVQGDLVVVTEGPSAKHPEMNNRMEIIEIK